MSNSCAYNGLERSVGTLTVRVCQAGGELVITSELWRRQDAPMVCYGHRDVPVRPRCEGCRRVIADDSLDTKWRSGEPVLCERCRNLPSCIHDGPNAFIEDLGRRRLLDVARSGAAA